MGIAEALKLFLTLMPVVIDTVKAVEAAVPQAGAGSEKLNAVLSVVQAGAMIADDTTQSVQDGKAAVQSGNTTALSAALTHVVNNAVTLLNAAGVFKKSS